MKTREQVSAHVRWIIRRDMPEVLSIEDRSNPEPWLEEVFLKHLRCRNCIGMVAEKGDQVVGFMVYILHKEHLEILNFAVDPELRRCGIGSTMLRKLKSKLSSHRRKGIQLELPESALPAHLFLRAEGFKAVRVHRGSYENGEDGYLFQHELATEG